MEILSTIIKHFFKPLIWPVFILILLWKRKIFLDPVLEFIGNFKEFSAEVFGQKVSFSPKDVEQRIEFLKNKLEQIYPKEIEYVLFPYIDPGEFENVVGRLQELEDLFDIKLDQLKDIGVLKLMGGYYFLTQDFEKSRKFYSLAETLSNNDVGLYNMIASVYRMLGDSIKALKYYEKAIKADSTFAWAFLGKASIYGKQPDKKEESENLLLDAEKKYKDLITNKSYDYFPHYGLADVYHYLGDYEKSKKSLDEAIILRPNFAPAYYNRAIANLKISKGKVTEDVVKDLFKCTKLNPLLKNWVINDEDFDPIRGHKCYKCLIEGKYTVED